MQMNCSVTFLIARMQDSQSGYGLIRREHLASKASLKIFLALTSEDKVEALKYNYFYDATINDYFHLINMMSHVC